MVAAADAISVNEIWILQLDVVRCFHSRAEYALTQIRRGLFDEIENSLGKRLLRSFPTSRIDFVPGITGDPAGHGPHVNAHHMLTGGGARRIDMSGLTHYQKRTPGKFSLHRRCI